MSSIRALHRLGPDSNETHWRVLNPRGQHSIAVGLEQPILVEVEGHVGYYCAGMNKLATVVVEGNAGQGVAENMMSGKVWVKGDASQAAGATGRGGLLVIDGNASARCGISMKGIDIVVKGSVGHLSAFMAQAGNLVVLGTRAKRSAIRSMKRSLSCAARSTASAPIASRSRWKKSTSASCARLLDAAGINGAVDIGEFRRYGSARKLYHFHVDNVGRY